SGAGPRHSRRGANGQRAGNETCLEIGTRGRYGHHAPPVERVGYMLRRTRLFAAMAVAATFLAPGLSGPAEAADAPKLLGKFDDWAAYTYGSGADRICYILSEPRSQEPKGA